MNENIKAFSQGLKYMESNETEPYELVRKSRYKRKDLGVEARVLNHWEKMGLLISENPNGAMYYFSLSEAFWIKIIQKLRAYNLPLDHIKKLKEQLTLPTTTQHLSEIDIEVKNLLLNKLSEDEKRNFDLFLKSTDFRDLLQKYQPTFLENILIDLILTRTNSRILINELGEVFAYNLDRKIKDKDYNDALEKFLNNTYLNISLIEILKELLNDLGEIEFSVFHNILTKEEAEILQLLKQENLTRIEITFSDTTKKPEIVKITRKDSINNLSRIQDLILRNGYQDITIKTQKGNVVLCTNTTKYKLDTE